MTTYLAYTRNENLVVCTATSPKRALLLLNYDPENPAQGVEFITVPAMVAQPEGTIEHLQDNNALLQYMVRYLRQRHFPVQIVHTVSSRLLALMHEEVHRCAGIPPV